MGKGGDMPVKMRFSFRRAAALCLLSCAAVLAAPGAQDFTAFRFSSPAQAQPLTSADIARRSAELSINSQSFYGAYLAGSYAADMGSPMATPYLRRALSLRPDDKVIRRELLLSLIDDSNYPAAVQLAASMRNDKDTSISPIVRLILAANALKQKQYSRVDALVSAGENKNEALLWVYLTAWADYGNGRKAKALKNLSQAQFSEWYAFLSAYNTALMEDLSGNKQRAAMAFQTAFEFHRLAEMAPETYEHLVWAYASFLQRMNGSRSAAVMLVAARNILSQDNVVFDALEAKLEAGSPIPRLVSTPAQGAAEFAYDIGTTFLRANEELYADIYLQTSVFLRPDSDAALFRLGILAAKTERPRKAQGFFAQIPPNSLYYSDMQLLTALSLNKKVSDSKNKKKDTEATGRLEQMIGTTKDKAVLQNILANLYLQTKDYNAALDLLNKIIAQIKTPSNEDWSIFFQRGIAYERLNNWPKAEEDFKEALTLNPSSSDVLNYYGYSLVDRDIDLNKGLDLVRKAAAIDGSSAEIIDSVGWAYYKLKRYDEAVPILEKAVRMDPGSSSINEHLGDAYWRTGHKLLAVFQWNHALAYGPEDEKEDAGIRQRLKSGLPDTVTADNDSARSGADNAANAAAPAGGDKAPAAAPAGKQ